MNELIHTGWAEGLGHRFPLYGGRDEPFDSEHCEKCGMSYLSWEGWHLCKGKKTKKEISEEQKDD